MITIQDGNILNADVDCIVNPVNTVGVMGAGLAKKIANRFPNLQKPYAEACKTKELDIGKVWFWQVHGPESLWIANFATKRHYERPSEIEFIESGIPSLIQGIRKNGIQSVAIPALGCGLGGLVWPRVKEIIISAFETETDIRVHLYVPK